MKPEELHKRDQARKLPLEVGRKITVRGWQRGIIIGVLSNGNYVIEVGSGRFIAKQSDITPVPEDDTL